MELAVEIFFFIDECHGDFRFFALLFLPMQISILKNSTGNDVKCDVIKVRQIVIFERVRGVIHNFLLIDDLMID